MLPALFLITAIPCANLFLPPPRATPPSPGALVLATEDRGRALWVDVYLAGCSFSSTLLLSHSERLAFRNVVSTRCTHNSTQSITAHNHRKYRMSLQRARSHVSPHTCHMSWCAHTHIAPRHMLPCTLLSAPTTHCTWAPAVRGED